MTVVVQEWYRGMEEWNDMFVALTMIAGVVTERGTPMDEQGLGGKVNEVNRSFA